MGCLCHTCDFCDYLSGRLILSHHAGDAAATAMIKKIMDLSIPEVTYREGMLDRLAARNVGLATDYRFRSHLLGVRAGDEQWAMNLLRFHYQQEVVGIIETGSEAQRSQLKDVLSDRDTHLLVVPDSALSLSAPVGFAFDATNHAAYLAMLGLPKPRSTGSGVKVAIIDSGLDPGLGMTISCRSANCGDDADTANVDDDLGHGSVVASIIHDIVPDAELTILKVGDGNPVSEWHVLSALIAAHGEDVVNMSLSFGLATRDCVTCGRHQTTSARSAVFEQAVAEQLRLRPACILVAAAGNRGVGQVDFPARFRSVVAVGAVDSGGAVSSFAGGGGSNYGTVAHDGSAHPFVFFAPGGGGAEHVATTTLGRTTSHQGTSFAAPYAAALIAHALGDPGSRRTGRAALDRFVNDASPSAMPGHNPTDHGHGLVQLL